MVKIARILCALVAVTLLTFLTAAYNGVFASQTPDSSPSFNAEGSAVSEGGARQILDADSEYLLADDLSIYGEDGYESAEEGIEQYDDGPREGEGPLPTITEYINTNDPAAKYTTYLNLINIQEAWEITKGSSEVTVAVIDSGLMGTGTSAALTPQLAKLKNEDIDYDNNIVKGFNSVRANWSTEDNCTDGKIPLGRGTQIIGALVAMHDNGIGCLGMCPGIKVMPIKNFEKDHNPWSVYDAEAIKEAIAKKVDIICINPSIDYNPYSGNGMFNFPVFLKMCEIAADKGIIVITGAGDRRSYLTNDFISIPSVIGVSATDSVSGKFADFSNFGYPNVTVSAPGEGVVGSGVYSATDISMVRGTAMSSALVTGVAALAKSVNKDLTPAEFYEILAKTSQSRRYVDPSTSYTVDGHVYDNRYGWGVVDAGAAVKAAKELAENPNIATGVSDEILWQIDGSGKLSMQPRVPDKNGFSLSAYRNFTSDEFTNHESDGLVDAKPTAINILSWKYWPWERKVENITEISITEPIVFKEGEKQRGTDYDYYPVIINNNPNLKNAFKGAVNCKSIDLSGFITTEAMPANNIFEGCTSLQTIKLGDGWKSDTATFPEVVLPEGEFGGWKKVSESEASLQSMSIDPNSYDDIHEYAATNQFYAAGDVIPRGAGTYVAVDVDSLPKQFSWSIDCYPDGAGAVDVVRVSGGAYGTSSNEPLTTDMPVYEGDVLSIDVGAARGYTLDSVLVNGSGRGLTKNGYGSYSYTVGNADVEISAEFAQQQYAIALDVGEGGTAELSRTSALFETEATVYVKANGSNYITLSVGDHGVPMDDLTDYDHPTLGAVKAFTFTVEDNTQVSVYFSTILHTITAAAHTVEDEAALAQNAVDAILQVLEMQGLSPVVQAEADDPGITEGGKISPSGAYEVGDGADAHFTITPEIGYEVHSLKVDDRTYSKDELPTLEHYGEAIGAEGYAYAFPAVAADHALDVYFVKAPIEEDPPAVDDPIDDPPAVDDPVVNPPAVDDPVDDPQTPHDPVDDPPAVNDPVDDPPAVDDQPAGDDPVDPPAVNDPVDDPPAVDDPREPEDVEKPPVEKVDSPIDDPVDDPTDDPVDDPTDNPIDDPIDDPVDDPTKVPSTDIPNNDNLAATPNTDANKSTDVAADAQQQQDTQKGESVLKGLANTADALLTFAPIPLGGIAIALLILFIRKRRKA